MQGSTAVSLKKINSRSVVQQVLDSLTEAMVNKQLKPGDKIPTEIELAEQLGVGRNSVREAIKILVYLGVLEIRRAEGTFVCEGISESMIDPMIYGIVLDKTDSYDNLMELREMIEVGVMQLAMYKSTPDEVNVLERKLDRLGLEIRKGKENVQQAFEADNEFHDTICEMGKNPLVNKINKVVRMLTYSMRYDSVKGMIESGRGQELYEAHLEIFRMMKAKDQKHLNTAVRQTYFTDVGQKE